MGDPSDVSICDRLRDAWTAARGGDRGERLRAGRSVVVAGMRAGREAEVEELNAANPLYLFPVAGEDGHQAARSALLDRDAREFARWFRADVERDEPLVFYDEGYNASVALTTDTGRADASTGVNEVEPLRNAADSSKVAAWPRRSRFAAYPTGPATNSPRGPL